MNLRFYLAIAAMSPLFAVAAWAVWFSRDVAGWYLWALWVFAAFVIWVLPCGRMKRAK